MGRQGNDSSHPDMMELAMVAEFLCTGRFSDRNGLPGLMNHLAVCSECRAEVIELTDVLVTRTDRHPSYHAGQP
ncbi:MAG TPA: hypothetical protein P5228_08195 [Bacteroidales bacterium]|nr:hypothetical protein [Bacteroidales bacterium]HRZ49834.1 hypothetical protein [Bacteroidales bacterium]